MSEIYISLLMEAEFTKEEIFSLYVNKIFLGQRAYGVGAAAEVYFGKTLDQLSIAEMATLAGIPTSPSTVSFHSLSLTVGTYTWVRTKKCSTGVM